ncbi:hypothetical protein PG993_000975 [Apiospora rasikravindrae]|uniref:DUF4419 domain-containing protein n=1 Tax=Apiospora rasikravindrae TaxID=990691 RepID=A0ABR1UA16_9PEZI
MPVTLKVAKHDARRAGGDRIGFRTLLERAAPGKVSEMGPIVQTSLPDEILAQGNVTPSTNGFIESAWKAYSYHHNLVIRPEDFSFYVNVNSEKLRDKFVYFEGKRALMLEQGFIDKVDFGSMCRNMTKLIEQNIVDPKLRAWVLPSFTTTTLTDETVAAILMMGTLQKYFEYMFDACTCGIPSVTLLGEKSDYEDIPGRREKLKEYGEQPTRWYKLLRPVLRYMIATFEGPADDPVIMDFWNRIVRYDSGSGDDTLTGWMMAFCFWDEDGKRMGGDLPEHGAYANYLKTAHMNWTMYTHEIKVAEMPAGWVSVPVTVLGKDKQVKTQLVAGSVGIAITDGRGFQNTTLRPSVAMGSTAAAAASPQGNTDSATTDLDTMQSLSGWWMYQVLGGVTAMPKDAVTEECRGGLSIEQVSGGPDGKVTSAPMPT